MKTRRYEGQVGDTVAVGYYEGDTLTAMMRGTVTDEVGGSARRVGVAINETTVRWFLRADGSQVKSNGHEYVGPGHRVLLGPWLDAYGADNINTADDCRAALRRAKGTGVRDPRQRSLAQCVPDLCNLFGVDPGDLRHRNAADPTDPEEMAHNVLRKFAVGAIVHLAYEIDIAWTSRGGGAARPNLRALSEIEALHGVHRGTLASFRAQFAAFAGLGVDDQGRARKPRSGLGMFARDRYAEIRRTAVADAATGAD